MSNEEKLRVQISNYRETIFDLCDSIHGVLIDRHLDFPVEDQTEFQKGYEKALRDYANEIKKLR